MADSGQPPALNTSPARRGTGIAVLLDASEAVAAHSLDFDGLLRELARIVRQVVDYEMYSVLIPDEDGHLRIAHAVGLPPELVKTLRVRSGEGLTGLAAVTREPVLADDVTREPRYVAGLEAVMSELAVPLVARDRVVAVLDLQSVDAAAFDSRASDLLALVASRFSLAIDVAQLYRAREKQRSTLETLHKVAEEYSTILGLDQLLRKIAELTRRLIPYDALAIYLKDRQAPRLRHYFGVKFDERVCWSDLQLGDGIVGQAAVALEPVLVENTASDPRYIESMPGIQSEVAVPLLLKGKLVGILDLESVSAARFGADDVSTLTLLAPQVAAAIENARLHEETVAKERRLAADLIAARALQNHLLPAAPERVSGLEVAARNAPASMVSGDFYDFYQRNGWFGFVNADVSGKGAAAAIYAALASGVFRTFAGPGRSPAETLACVNQSLADRQIEGQFVAATFGVWNAERGLLEMAGAGMPYPCVIRGGRPEAAEMPGLPLGLFRDATYETKRFALCPGDIVLSVSDGFSEGGGPSGDAHGEQRILDFVADRCGMPAKQIVDEMFDTLRASNGDGGQWDDETAIVMKVAA